MKKFWRIVKYFFIFIPMLGIIYSICRMDLELLFENITCLLFWILIILDQKSMRKNKMVTIFYWSGFVILILLYNL